MIASFTRVAKWYGPVIGLVDVSVEVGPGILGLLGPNGAGKSTFLKLLTGQLVPSQGEVRLLGEDPFLHPRVHTRVGFSPEQDAFYEDSTGLEFVTYLTRLQGFSGAEAKRRAGSWLERVGLADAAGRKIQTYSKGMRQRVKLAQALAHDPQVLLLDEPLNGMDPVARKKTIDLVRELADEGKTVLVSSHILHEVEAMTHEVLLLYQGRVLAQGSIEEIRGLLDRYPLHIRMRTSRARDLACALLRSPGVVGVRLADGVVDVEASDPEQVYERLSGLVLDDKIPVDAVEATDVSLDAIFSYLVR